MNIIERLFLSIETYTAFNANFYSILFNPFFITRKQLFLACQEFSKIVSTEDTLLDVGCGTKPYRKLFRCKKYVGIDVKGGGLRDKTKVVDKYFDGGRIPYKSNSFEVVIATEVLEHALFPEKLFKEMTRVLKPKGKLFVSMPFVWPEHGVPYDFQRFTSFKHKLLLEKNNLQVISIKKTTGVFGTCGQLISDFFYGLLAEKIFRLHVSYGIKFMIFRLFCFLFCFPVQLVFELLDMLNRRKGITLDFVIIAQK